jgi:hypothetical protein
MLMDLENTYVDSSSCKYEQKIRAKTNTNLGRGVISKKKLQQGLEER